MSFQVKGIQLFVEKKLVDALPESGGRINVLMGDYGSWTVTIQQEPFAFVSKKVADKRENPQDG